MTDIKTRFWSKVKKTETCWLWTGCISAFGYGQLYRTKKNGGQTGAHRISYELNIGKIPPGLAVLHKCDCRKCVNPKHLFLGTAKDNSRDMVKKGRSLPREKNPNTKLTAQQVKYIREKYEEGEYDQPELAAIFKVIQAHISRIIRGVCWAAPDKQEGVSDVK